MASVLDVEQPPAQRSDVSTTPPAQHAASFNTRSDDALPSMYLGVVYCGYCDELLKGVRFKCADCFDYDLCSGCVSEFNAIETHNGSQSGRSHRFQLIHSPASSSSAPTDHLVPTLAPRIVDGGDSSPSRTASEAIRIPNVSCSRCMQTIVRDRHRCVDCARFAINFEYCSRCIQTAEITHPDHQFLKIDVPVIHPVSYEDIPRPDSPVRHHTLCNLCDNEIVGERLKCTSCPDYDLCSSCLRIAPDQHPNHAFIRIRETTDIVFAPLRDTIAHGVHCNNCEKSIIGPRYKCLYPTCPNADFCQHCEALPLPVHPKNHPLVKLTGDISTYSGLQNAFAQIHRACVPTFDGAVEAQGPVQLASYLSEPVEHVDEPSSSVNRRAVSSTLDAPEPAPSMPQMSMPRLPISEPLAEHLPVVDTFNALPERSSSPRASSWPSMDLQPTPAPAWPGPLPIPTPQTTPFSLFPNAQEVPVITRATAPAPVPVDIDTTLHATFLADNNIPNGQAIHAGTQFMKSWSVHNSGHVPWPGTTEIVFCAGNRLGSGSGSGERLDMVTDSHPVGKVEPGECIDVDVMDMRAPEEPGSYISVWRLRDSAPPMGEFFGDPLCCEIVVLQPETTTPEASLSSLPIGIPTEAPLLTTANVASINNLSTIDLPKPTAAPVSRSASLNDLSSVESDISEDSDASLWADTRPAANGAAAAALQSESEAEFVLIEDTFSTDGA